MFRFAGWQRSADRREASELASIICSAYCRAPTDSRSGDALADTPPHKRDVAPTPDEFNMRYRTASRPRRVAVVVCCGGVNVMVLVTFVAARQASAASCICALVS